MSDPPADTIADEPIKKKPVCSAGLKKGCPKPVKSSPRTSTSCSAASTIDDDMLEELEELLITSDIGVQTAMDLMKNITKRASKISTPEELKASPQSACPGPARGPCRLSPPVEEINPG
jgi:signal recognition particle GTPase